MKGSGLRVDTRPCPPKTNMMPMSFDRQPQGHIPGAEFSTSGHGHHHPSTFHQHLRQTSQTHAMPRCYSQCPPSQVTQPSRRVVQVEVSSNHAAQQPPAPATRYHQHSTQRESASKQYGQEPSLPRPTPQANMGHWVHSMPKVHPAHAGRQGNPYADPNGQSRPMAANHAVNQHNRPEHHGWTSVNRPSSSSSHIGRQYTGASQPPNGANGHRVTSLPQNMPYNARGQQLPQPVPVTHVIPAKDLKDRQALMAAWKRLEVLERKCDAIKEHHDRLERSYAETREHHGRKLSALESKYEGFMDATADGIARYRDAHGRALPSTSSRGEIRAMAVHETTRAYISAQTPDLPSEKNIHEVTDVTTTPLVQTDKSDAPCHSITSIRDTIEPGFDIDRTSITPCQKLQARKPSKVKTGTVRERSNANGGSPKPRLGRYNMRKRVQGRVQKPAKKRF